MSEDYTDGDDTTQDDDWIDPVYLDAIEEFRKRQPTIEERRKAAASVLEEQRAEYEKRQEAQGFTIGPDKVAEVLSDLRTKPTAKSTKALAQALERHMLLAEAQALYEQATNPVGPLVLVSEADVQARPAPEWWIDGLLQKGTIAVLAGEAGVGKTFTSIHASRCIATGTRFFGREVRKGSVLYVAAEGASAFGSRVRAWDDYHHLSPDPGAINYLESGVDLMNTSSVDRLIALLDDLQPDLIILDTLSQLASIDNENDAGKMSEVFRVAKRLRDRKVDSTVLFVHHVNKGSGGVRGSSVIRSNVDTVIVAKAQQGGFYLTTELSADGKQKDGMPEKIEGFRLDSHNGSAVVTWTATKAVDEDWDTVRDLFSDGLEHSKTEMRTACGILKADNSDPAYKKWARKFKGWEDPTAGMLYHPPGSKNYLLVGIAGKPAPVVL